MALRLFGRADPEGIVHGSWIDLKRTPSSFTSRLFIPISIVTYIWNDLSSSKWNWRTLYEILQCPSSILFCVSNGPSLHVQIMQLPYIFKDYDDYNAREEIFNAIVELSSTFSGFRVCLIFLIAILGFTGGGGVATLKMADKYFT